MTVFLILFFAMPAHAETVTKYYTMQNTTVDFKKLFFVCDYKPLQIYNVILNFYYLGNVISTKTISVGINSYAVSFEIGDVINDCDIVSLEFDSNLPFQKLDFVDMNNVNFETAYAADLVDTSPVPPDTTAPATPTGLSATHGDGQVSLAWNVNNETDFDHYVVYRNGVLLATSTTATYNDTDVTNGNQYQYQIASADTSNNISAKSAIVSATPGDITAPATPTGLSVTPGDGQVVIIWDANTDTDFDHYLLYRDGVFIATSTTTGFTDIGLMNGTEYSYQVAAVDSSNNISVKSAIVSATPVHVVPVLKNLYLNPGKIIIQVTWQGGESPYTVQCGGETKTIDNNAVNFDGLTAGTDYTVSVTSSDGQTISKLINTGYKNAVLPPIQEEPTAVYQNLLDTFGTAGKYAIAIIGGAVLLGILVILAIYAWRLLKNWLNKVK